MARQALAALAGSQNTLDAAKTNLAPLPAQPAKAAPLLMQSNTLLGKFVDKTEVDAAVWVLTEPYLALPEAHFAGKRAVSRATAKDYDAALSVAKAQSMRPDWSQAAILRSQVLRDRRLGKPVNRCGSSWTNIRTPMMSGSPSVRDFWSVKKPICRRVNSTQKLHFASRQMLRSLMPLRCCHNRLRTLPRPTVNSGVCLNSSRPTRTCVFQPWCGRGGAQVAFCCD